jgi:hypothetical protein
MKLFNKKIFTLFLGFFSFFGFSVKAVCPVCVVAVGAGVGLCRWLGIDDVISGLWIGGMLVAVSLLTIFWFQKKNWKFKFYQPAIFLMYYFLTIWPLLSFNIMGHPLNKLWGMDKILLGLVTGTMLFFVSVFLDKYLRRKNNGKVYFYYQKIIIPVALLLIFSFIFYFLINC